MVELLKDLGGLFSALLELFLMAPLTCIVWIVMAILVFAWLKHVLDWANAGWPDEWPPKK